MIERGAEAMRAARRELINQPLDRIWPDLMRAAIEAMQEPTDEMIDFGQKIYTETSDVRDAYVAMVHTAYSRDIPY